MSEEDGVKSRVKRSTLQFAAVAFSFTLATLVGIAILAGVVSDVALLYLDQPVSFLQCLGIAFLSYALFRPPWPGALSKEDVTVVQFVLILFSPVMVTMLVWVLARLVYGVVAGFGSW